MSMFLNTYDKNSLGMINYRKTASKQKFSLKVVIK